MIYLASPYSAKSKEVQDARYEAVRLLTRHYIRIGKRVYSPIVHCHMLDLSLTHEQWLEHDKYFLELSDMLYVAIIPGWSQSKGVLREMTWAKEYDMTIVHIHPRDIVPNSLLEKCHEDS